MIIMILMQYLLLLIGIAITSLFFPLFRHKNTSYHHLCFSFNKFIRTKNFCLIYILHFILYPFIYLETFIILIIKTF
jgi:hypothetical protein